MVRDFVIVGPPTEAPNRLLTVYIVFETGYATRRPPSRFLAMLDRDKIVLHKDSSRCTMGYVSHTAL